MYNVLAVIFCAVIFCSCSDSRENTDIPPIQNDFSDSVKADTTKGSGYVDGLHYNTDSITYNALKQYNAIELGSICSDIIENIIQKNKKEEGKLTTGTRYGFSVDQTNIDSLLYYNIRKEDISYTDPNALIYISGFSPYKEKEYGIK